MEAKLLTQRLLFFFFLKYRCPLLQPLHVCIVKLAVWSGVDQLDKPAELVRRREGPDHTLECLHGSGVFIDYICSRLKGHRRYKYIWKSLFTVEAGEVPPLPSRVRAVRLCTPPSPDTIFDPPLASDGRPLRFIRTRFMLFFTASLLSIVAELAAGRVFLPACSY